MELIDSNLKFDRETLFITMCDQNLKKIANAINGLTRWNIIRLLNKERMDISKIARELQLSESTISSHIKILQNAGIVSVQDEPGIRGLRKVCKLTFNQMLIEFD